MNFTELLEFLRKNYESQEVEFKKSYKHEEIGECIAAFGTKGGGKIVIGIDEEDRSPVGFEPPGNFEEQVRDISKQIIKGKAIEVELIEKEKDSKKKISIIHVPESIEKPCQYRGRYLLREGKTNKRLSAQEITKMHLETSNITFDSLPAKRDREATLEDIDETKVIDFVQKRQAGGKVFTYQNKQQLLRNNNLLSDGYLQPSNAAIMFFGKEPQRFIPSLSLSMIKFLGTTISPDFQDKKVVTGDILTLLSGAFSFIQRNIRTASKVEGVVRIQMAEYPLDALKEAIINALIHRDYFVESEISIWIFDDRIEIVNPGGLPYKWLTKGMITKPDAGGLSVRRNRLLADLLEDYGLIEKAGTGIPKMRVLTKNHGLKEPTFDIDPEKFKIVFWGPGEKIIDVVKQSISQDDISQLNQRQVDVLKYLSEKGQITTKEFKERYKVSRATATRDLQELHMKGYIKSEGKTRSKKYLK